jgi:anti-anti-sigma factor
VTEATVEVEMAGEETLRIALRGEVDLANVSIVEAELLPAISNQLVDVIVDMRDMSYIDSAGLRAVFALGARLDTLQIGFHLGVPPGSTVRRVVELSGLAALASLEP